MIDKNFHGFNLYSDISLEDVEKVGLKYEHVIFNGFEYVVIDGKYFHEQPKGKVGWIWCDDDEWSKNDVDAYFYLDERMIDERIIDWYREKVKFTQEEEIAFYESLNRDFYNPKAERLVRFVMEYQGGLLLQNRWNFFEPIKHHFDLNDAETMRKIVSHLSMSGSVFFKKVKEKFRCNVFIDNGEFLQASGSYDVKKKGGVYHYLIYEYREPLKGRPSVSLHLKLTELRKLKKDPIEFVDEFAAALGKEFKVFKYYAYVERNPMFYRKPTHEVIYYDIPECHEDWRPE